MTLLHEKEVKEKKSMKDFSMVKICEAYVAFRELIVFTSPCRFLMKLIIVMDSRFSSDFFFGHRYHQLFSQFIDF